MVPRSIRLMCIAIASAASLPVAGAPPATAQRNVNAVSPALPNSAQRRAILAALRPAVESRLGPNVEFMVGDIRVRRGWAIVHADPRRRGGGRIDGRRIFPNYDEMDGLTVTAILRYQNGRWGLVDHAIGATDAWYCAPRIAAPRELTAC
ncbi:hypothetical protein [Sphingosinicella sp. YJ22]|uniref:hypothetical protein n=1 Tax=Sphingosinicella sp. YJ22 TaxID=1104780 RepID=UPI00140A87FE|nr:hypothetical protein [Sphingosinicella sp. YJ22]